MTQVHLAGDNSLEIRFIAKCVTLTRMGCLLPHNHGIDAVGGPIVPPVEGSLVLTHLQAHFVGCMRLMKR